MENLIRWLGRPEHVMIDPAVGYRVEDRLAGRSVPHVTPRHQKPAVCVRVKAACLFQQLVSGHSRELLSGKDQGDLLVAGRKVLEEGKRFARRSHARDAIMPRVAVAQLPLNVTQRTFILVNHDKHRARHKYHSIALLPTVHGPCLSVHSIAPRWTSFSVPCSSLAGYRAAAGGDNLSACGPACP